MIADNIKIARVNPPLGDKRIAPQVEPQAPAEPQDSWSYMSINSLGVVLYQLGNQPQTTEVKTSSYNDFRQNLIEEGPLPDYASNLAVHTGHHVQESKKTLGKAALWALAATGFGIGCLAALPVLPGLAIGAGIGALVSGTATAILGNKGWEQRTNPQHQIAYTLESHLAKVETASGTQFATYFLMDGQYIAHGRPHTIEDSGYEGELSLADRLRRTPSLSDIQGYNSQTHFSVEQCKPQGVSTQVKQY